MKVCRAGPQGALLAVGGAVGALGSRIASGSENPQEESARYDRAIQGALWDGALSPRPNPPQLQACHSDSSHGCLSRR